MSYEKKDNLRCYDRRDFKPIGKSYLSWQPGRLSAAKTTEPFCNSSDEFIQAQQAQARNANGGGEEGRRPREYFPSPASTSSEDSSPSGPQPAAPEYNH